MSLRLEVSIDDQELRLIHNGEVERRMPVSTAAKGAGCRDGSHRTPTGRFRIAEKIGAGADPDTAFRGRRPEARWNGGEETSDLILSRILWLDGLEPHNANTRDRYIYLHGTNHESRLGSPASIGCVRLSRADIVELFDRVEVDTPVEILPPSRPRGNLIFLDCDSTLSTIEGIDELARARGPETFAEVEALTHAAMNGEVPIEEVFPRRIDIIRPDRTLCDEVARRYIDTITPGTPELMTRLREDGWTPVILSGGFAPLIEPLAASLDIKHVEAVPLQLDAEGRYLGFDANYPTTRNGGKPEVIREWREALLPERCVMVGDGISDLETREVVDLFVGYGGVVAREPVREGCDLWVTHMDQLSEALVGGNMPQ